MEDIVYDWNFNSLEVVYNEGALTNVIDVVYWQLSAVHTSSGIRIETTGSVSLEPPTVETFIPFEELTKETVRGWVETKLGEETINNLKQRLNTWINDQINPTRGSVSPPWN